MRLENISELLISNPAIFRQKFARFSETLNLLRSKDVFLSPAFLGVYTKIFGRVQVLGRLVTCDGVFAITCSTGENMVKLAAAIVELDVAKGKYVYMTGPRRL